MRCGSSGRISRSTAPERAAAALTNKAEATMTTMSSLKPVKAACAGTISDTSPASRASIANQVIGQPAPGEGAYGHTEDAEGKGLIERHIPPARTGRCGSVPACNGSAREAFGPGTT